MKPWETMGNHQGLTGFQQKVEQFTGGSRKEAATFGGTFPLSVRLILRLRLTRS